MTAPSQKNSQHSQSLPLILWFAMLVALFIYAFVAWVLTKEMDPLTANLQTVSQLQTLFGVLSLILAGSIPTIKKILSSSRTPSPDQKNIFIAQVVSWALCESIAVFGLVLSFLGKDFDLFFPFGAASILLMSYHRPKKST